MPKHKYYIYRMIKFSKLKYIKNHRSQILHVLKTFTNIICPNGHDKLILWYFHCYFKWFWVIKQDMFVYGFYLIKTLV